MNQTMHDMNLSGLKLHLAFPSIGTNVLDLSNEAMKNQQILLSLCGQDSVTKYLVGGRIPKEDVSHYRRAVPRKNLIDSLVSITPRSFGLAVVSAPINQEVDDALDVSLSAYPLPNFDSLAKRNVRIQRNTESSGMELELEEDDGKEKESFEQLVEKEALALRKAELKRIHEIDENLETKRLESTYISEAYRVLAPDAIIVWIVPRVLLDKNILDRFHSRFYDVDVYRLEDDVRLVFMGKRRQITETHVVPESRAQQIYRYGLEKEPLPIVGETSRKYTVPALAPDAVRMFRIGSVTEDEINELAQPDRLLHQALADQLNTLSFDQTAPAPLQKGHLVQLLTSGVIDSYIGEGEFQHLVKGQSIKMIAERETVENETRTKTETDYYTVKLKLLLPNGEFYTIR